MNKTFIIAEAGDNHNGNFDLALKLVDIAVEAKADCVKFQTFITENIIAKNAKKADYQIKNTGSTENQFEMVKKLELSFEQFKEIKKYCDKKNILFLSTPFDLDSIDFLNSIEIPFWKIPSGEITNLPYLEKIAKTGKDIIMSTGMATMSEISETLNVLRSNGSGKITLLHCNTEYPTPMIDVNLKAMQSFAENFQVDFGYSDHTVGIEVPIAAVALGASVIEKHFTIDKNMEGPDHKASLEPNELKEMVTSIRNIELALGSSFKFPTPSESKNKDIARKSIVAKTNIRRGDILTTDNVTTKRPGTGISPMCWYDIIGTKAIKDFIEDEEIKIEEDN
ncbi:MAG: N-acetylneuraminate synthase [Erysipelotrichales bacterium]|nr:N-acetylneuraminate synthase [Erysipelotrichales bacterium]